LFDDLAIAELRKPLGHSQHPLDRSFAPRTEQRDEVALARFRPGRLTDAADVTEPPVGIADRDRALPVTAFQGGGVRLAPRRLRGPDVVPGQRRVDLLEMRAPCDLRLGPQGVIGEQIHGQAHDDHQRGHRGDCQDQRGIRTDRPGFLQ